MGIFDSLEEQDLADSATDPKRLFRALSKPTGSPYKFPHDIQSEVWDKWYPRRNEPDLVIKMNTGSGKTVIGLLILKSSLNESVGPAVFLVPDKQLQGQAQTTADLLGIPWTSSDSDPAFRQGEAILIAPIHKLYNGKSVFGVTGSGRAPLALGTIVIDDAHACIPIIEQQFSLKFEQGSDVYSRLLALFKDSLKSQSMSGYLGIEDRDGSTAVPVPYWDWQRKQEEVFKILKSGSGADVAKFIWPLISEQLHLCDVAFTPSVVEIKLPLPNLSTVPSFTDAKRRIYMTATLADDSILTTHMNVQASCVTDPVIPASASDLGDRIILTPLETSRKVRRIEVVEKLVEWSNEHNVVVISPSRKRAEEWNEATSEIHDKSSIEGVVSRLQAGHVGLVVLIARYDGVDLPGDACRILVLDGLPELNSPCESVEVEATKTADDLNRRQIQRIEQGMGRGVRATDDYCAVVLLDPRLIERLYLAADKQGLSPATRAQYELSTTFARAGRAKGIEFFTEAVESFLARDPAWTKASKKAIEAVTYSALETVPVEATAQRAAFEHALAGRYAEAKRSLDPAVTSASKLDAKGWMKQRAAGYLNLVDEVGARALQQSARMDNSRILKLPNPVKAPRQSTLGNQAAAAAAYIRASFGSPIQLSVSVEATIADLAPSEEHGSSKKFERALESVGQLLGFSSSRPDLESGLGPDNLWGVGDDHFWVIEAKSESVATEVSRGYLEQLTHSSDWFEFEYSDARYSYVPVLIHPSARPMADAVPRQGAKVITFDKLGQFREAIRKFASAVAAQSSMTDETAIRSSLQQLGLSSGQLEEKWTTRFEKR